MCLSKIHYLLISRNQIRTKKKVKCSIVGENDRGHGNDIYSCNVVTGIKLFQYEPLARLRAFSGLCPYRAILYTTLFTSSTQIWRQNCDAEELCWNNSSGTGHQWIKGWTEEIKMAGYSCWGSVTNSWNYLPLVKINTPLK